MQDFLLQNFENIYLKNYTSILHVTEPSQDMTYMGLPNKYLSRKIVLCSQTIDLVRDKLSVVNLGLVSTRSRKGQELAYGLKYP